MTPPVRPVAFVTTAARLAFAALKDGRLSWSPRRWLLDLRHLSGLMASARPASGAGVRSLPAGFADADKAALTQRSRTALIGYLRSGARLRFEPGPDPCVSVVLVLHNRAELTLTCLRSLQEVRGLSLEVVVVDNGSSDETAELLDRLDCVRVIRPGQNLGYIEACNRAARAASGEFILFLNNDTELLPGTVEQAVAAIRRDPSVGAVGGRLILPGGELQEAGSIVWNDGSCEGHGRGGSPWAGEFSFAREVDYCSAALLLTPRRLFEDLGGFDDRFKPAYYEDADYCIRLWQAGRSVLYHPGVTALHFEFASSASPRAAERLQVERRALFVEKHRTWLAKHHRSRSEGQLLARCRRAAPRTLVIDDRVPDLNSGFGFPRAVELLRALADLGHQVTLYPTAVASGPAVGSGDLPRTVEVILDGPHALQQFMADRRGYYDTIVVSRFHNMELLRSKLGPPETWSDGARVIYDAEALFALREIGRRQVSGAALTSESAGRLVQAEVNLARNVDAILTVSEQERAAFASEGLANVHVVTHAVTPSITPSPFDARQGLLFVGAFHPVSPNADAVMWFAREVLPRIRSEMGMPVPFSVAGQSPPAELRALARDAIRVLGDVAELDQLYDEARVFVAPTRFSAGIPLKVVHAAAHGIPVVATPQLARQLGWRHRIELLEAESARAFAAACCEVLRNQATWESLRAAAHRRVEQDFSRDGFRAALARAVAETPVEARASRRAVRTDPLPI